MLADSLPALLALGGGVVRMGRMGNVIGPRHPNEPHWYLAALGTDPARHGQGVGSALLAPILARCDAEGVPAYLETQNEANVAFYGKRGFQVREEVDVAGMPKLWLLWREPATSRSQEEPREEPHQEPREEPAEG